MALDPDNSISQKPVHAPARVIGMYQIIGFVLPWNTAFKASLGAYASRLQPVKPSAGRV